MFNVRLDQRSWNQINRFFEGSELWEMHMHDRLSEDLAKSAKEHMKPMLHVRPVHTGKLEQSITEQIHFNNEGFDIEFYGLLYGLWVDTGNFPPSTTIDASSYGYKAFPVDARLGASNPQRVIHGMGSQNTNAPTHYSEKTAKWLAEDEATKIGMEHLEMWLGSVVLR
jgi:hypothetical protein